MAPKKVTPLKYRLRDYVECLPWRNKLSDMLGTRVSFASGHWKMTQPIRCDTNENFVQWWDTQEEFMDANCSLYSLYNELRWSFKDLTGSEYIPELQSAIGEVERKALRPVNLALMKEYLPLLTEYNDWPLIVEWEYTHSTVVQKKEFRDLLAVYDPYS